MGEAADVEAAAAELLPLAFEAPRPAARRLAVSADRVVASNEVDVDVEAVEGGTDAARRSAVGNSGSSASAAVHKHKQ